MYMLRGLILFEDEEDFKNHTRSEEYKNQFWVTVPHYGGFITGVPDKFPAVFRSVSTLDCNPSYKPTNINEYINTLQEAIKDSQNSIQDMENMIERLKGA